MGETGFGLPMSDEDRSETEEESVATRALVGEEHDVGSDDPRARARAILGDSGMRTRERDAAPGSFVEHWRSEDTAPPEDTPG